MPENEWDEQIEGARLGVRILRRLQRTDLDPGQEDNPVEWMYQHLAGTFNTLVLTEAALEIA